MELAFLFIALFFVWLILLESRITHLSDKVNLLLKEKQVLPPAKGPSAAAPEPQTPPQPRPETPQPAQDLQPQETPIAEPVIAAAQPAPAPEPVTVAAARSNAPSVPQSAPAKEEKKPSKPVSFVELFSWIGGFILLLGVLFWIKYALENNIISPFMRIALGTVAGIALWTAGAAMRKPKVKTTSDTLCACGLCTCYAVWFAAYYFYHMISPAVTFVLLFLIALASFATAVWKKAQYIGVLAQLVGFVTPFLFPSDSPRIWFLLVYTGLINAAAIAAAVKRNWTHQLFTGLAFTFLCFLAIIQVGTPLQLAFFPGVFVLLYAAIAVRRQQTPLLRASFALAAVGLLVLGLHTFSVSTESMLCLMGFGAIFSIGFGLLAARQKNQELYLCTLGFALLSFVLLVKGTTSFLALYIFVFLLCAFFGGAASFLKNRVLQISSMALAAVGFILLSCSQPQPFLQSAHLPYLTVFTVLFSLLFGLISYKQKNKELFLCTVVLTLLCFSWLVPFKNEFYLTALAGIFTLFFGITSARMKDFSLQLASVLFTSICTLLICTLGTLNLQLVIGATLAAAVFYGYFAVKQKNGALLGTAAASAVLPFLMLTVYTVSNHRGSELIPWLFAWNALVLGAVFYFKEYFKDSKTAWAAAFGCNLLTGTLLLILCQNTHALAPYVGRVSFCLFVFYAFVTERVFHWQKLEEGIQYFRMRGLAWAPIVFLTFAIWQELSLEWKTIALALEGTTLIWLWHKLKLDMLQEVGMGIFAVVWMRLLLNPAIFSYYPETELFCNWYLYTYLLCAAAMFTGAYYWRKTGNTVAVSILRGMGGLLLFALVNIEIACYFSGGQDITFNICGEFAEAAAYTVAWATCGALCMFMATQKSPWLLRVGIGLIALAVLKLFLADIWQLSSGLRVAALFAVSIIMLGVSFVYQQTRKQKH